MKPILKYILFYLCLFSSCECNGKAKNISRKNVAAGPTKTASNASKNPSLKETRANESVTDDHSNKERGELEQSDENSNNENSGGTKNPKNNIESLEDHTKEELTKQAEFSLVILNLVNELRTEPLKFKIHLESLKKCFLDNQVDEKSYRIGKNLVFKTKEGIKAIDEAIAYVEKMAKKKPLKAFVHNIILDKSSLLHAKCMREGKFFAHENEKNKLLYNPWDRVKQYCKSYTLCAENLWSGKMDETLSLKEQAITVVVALFIDDGVPSRGHRDNLLLQDATDLGVALWPYEGEKSVFVMNFGAGIVV